MPDGLEGERVDAAIARLFGLSRTRAADLAAAGDVSVNASSVGKSHRVSAGDMLEVALPSGPAATLEVVAEPVPGMSVVHDDDDIVVVDKPVGVAAHPSVGWSGPNVLAGLKAAGYRISTSGASERQGIVSRLDVGTSGPHGRLQERARLHACSSGPSRSVGSRRRTTRSSRACPDPLVGTIDAPIGRHPGHDYKFAVMDSGKHAVTHYELLEAFRHASLLEIRLETGRTHQIRVHMAAVRHPCVGDPTYGADPTLAKRLGLERQWLHAVGLGFEHPGSGEWVTFESSYPQDLRDALDRL